MTDNPNALARYRTSGSEAAFTELATNYVDLVYSTALRLANGDTHMAEDITQVVFVDLARQARSFSPHVLLGGWLHRHACFVALHTIRGERRRLARETEAAHMNLLNDNTSAEFAELAPVLDKAINTLKEEHRAAILLRFFEGLDLRSVGQALGITENAAQKRVSAALEQLRTLVANQGATLSVGALATAMAGQVVHSAPAGLAKAMVGTAISTLGTNAGGTTLNLFKLMTATKVKATIVSAVLIAGSALLLQQHRVSSNLRAEIAMLMASPKKTEPASNPLPTSQATLPPRSTTLDDKSELLRLRGQVSALRLELQERPVSKAVLGWSAAFEPFDLAQFADSTMVIRASQATNAGTATPAALLQTWLWAQRTADVEGWLNTVEKPPDTPDEKWMEAANDMARKQQAAKQSTNSESSGGTFEDYRLSALLPMGDDYFLALFGEYNIRMGSYVGKQVFHRSNGQWRVTAYVPRK